MRPAALTSLALMTALASGFSISPQQPLSPNPSAGVALAPTSTVRRRPVQRIPLTPLSAPALSVRGGGLGGSKKQPSKTQVAAATSESKQQETSGAEGPISFLASAWGAGGVCYILAKAIKRVVPIALEPFSTSGAAAAAAEGAAAAATPLTTVQLVIYIATCAWFAYVEGYKGFQKKFSPLVVSRARTLIVGQSSYVHILFAPLYSMGLFHATKKRMAVSWGVTLGVAAIVAGVKRLPYPWRNIVDAGVVVGLTWGTVSILWNFVKAMTTGKSPSDPALPEKK